MLNRIKSGLLMGIGFVVVFYFVVLITAWI